MRIKGVTNAVPEIPGAQKLGTMASPMGALAGQGPAGATATPGASAPNASQQAFAKRIMGMTPQKFAQLMTKLGAGPIV